MSCHHSPSRRASEGLHGWRCEHRSVVTTLTFDGSATDIKELSVRPPDRIPSIGAVYQVQAVLLLLPGACSIISMTLPNP